MERRKTVWLKRLVLSALVVLLFCGMFYFRPQMLESMLAQQLPEGRVEKIVCLDHTNMWLDNREYIITDQAGIDALMDFFSEIRIRRDAYYSISNSATYKQIDGQEFSVTIYGEGSNFTLIRTAVGLNGQRYVDVFHQGKYRVLSWHGFAEIGYLAREYGELQ